MQQLQCSNAVCWTNLISRWMSTIVSLYAPIFCAAICFSTIFDYPIITYQKDFAQRRLTCCHLSPAKKVGQITLGWQHSGDPRGSPRDGDVKWTQGKISLRLEFEVSFVWICMRQQPERLCKCHHPDTHRPQNSKGSRTSEWKKHNNEVGKPNTSPSKTSSARVLYTTAVHYRLRLIESVH